MIQFDTPVKFQGTDVKEGISKKTGKEYRIREARLFVPELGIVKVPVTDKATVPDSPCLINLALSVNQGSFQSMKVQWDENSKYQVTK